MIGSRTIQADDFRKKDINKVLRQFCLATMIKDENLDYGWKGKLLLQKRVPELTQETIDMIFSSGKTRIIENILYEMTPEEMKTFDDTGRSASWASLHIGERYKEHIKRYCELAPLVESRFIEEGSPTPYNKAPKDLNRYMLDEIQPYLLTISHKLEERLKDGMLRGCPDLIKVVKEDPYFHRAVLDTQEADCPDEIFIETLFRYKDKGKSWEELEHTGTRERILSLIWSGKLKMEKGKV